MFQKLYYVNIKNREKLVVWKLFYLKISKIVITLYIYIYIYIHILMKATSTLKIPNGTYNFFINIIWINVLIYFSDRTTLL
jgi:hypothetical protein